MAVTVDAVNEADRDTRRVAVEALLAQGRLAAPATLPIAERQDEIVAAIRDHQVVIVAGETGSGKSTQLPKFCLQLARGVDGLIGHTQPRRVAARTIAERVADELGEGPWGSGLGDAVGYTVRFTDRVGPQTLVKVMTDGILLAEIQRDRMLRRYDTLIIDEAHERSLNIDFILGYLKQLLPKRPDLKVIVTSATIDTQRFSEHFADAARVPAPIIEVVGRTYPVELRYRPYGVDPDDDRDQVQAICDAVEELARTDLGAGNGDVLVFLSGEREIHDTADALRRLDLRNTEVLPLYARLSAVEQHRIFAGHTGRRIVLSTNVAETSLTVQGVRYVVDAGSARISRYSHRLKVQRLPIEPISQASANQRSGRCGRVAPGIAIRLYAQDDFEARPEFTEPEVLRTNLASVILQMTAIGLGDIAAFPFVEAPDSRSIRDGYALLEELGALDPPDATGQRRLTKIGRRLARLPIDPRLGRMVLEADRTGCVREVMVIAAALSIQDPREHPAEHRQAADEAHARFNVAGSDFLALVKLWDYLRERQQALSSSQFRKLCRTEYLNYLRVREWQDLFSQLRRIAGDEGVRSTAPAGGVEAGHPDNVHKAVLAGLLSHLGMRDGLSREFRGAFGSKFLVGKGSAIAKNPPKWLMAAELVETNRLWARMGASIKPEWAEQIAGPLVKYSYGEPTWDERSGRAVVVERATLYGLPIISGRTIGLDRVDRETARDMFIQHALVDGEWTTPHRFIADNRRTVEELRTIGDRARRADIIEHDAVFRFYDERVGADVVSGRHFDQWWKKAKPKNPKLMTLTVEALLGPQGNQLPADLYPDAWVQGALRLRLSYRFEPGSPDDGVTLHIPLVLLNQVRNEGFDWQVAGFRETLVATLAKTLPKEIRREMVPAAETVRAAYDRLRHEGTLAEAFAVALAEVIPVPVTAADVDAARIPDHLRITFSIEDDAGTSIARGKDLDALRRQLNAPLRRALREVLPIDERKGIVEWDVDEVREVVTATVDGGEARGYPALLDDGDSVSLTVFTSESVQHTAMTGGVRRLLLLSTTVSRKTLERQISNGAKLAMARVGGKRWTPDVLIDEALQAVADDVIRVNDLPWRRDEFAALAAEFKRIVADSAAHALQQASVAIVAAGKVADRLDRLVAPALATSVADARGQMQRLVRPGFVASAGTRRLVDVQRYLTAIDRRLDKLASDTARDLQRVAEVRALENRYVTLLDRLGRQVSSDVVELGWQLEELRVGVFAQAVGTNGTVSVKRVQRALADLGA